MIMIYPLLICCYVVRRQRLIFDLPQGKQSLAIVTFVAIVTGEWQQWWIGTAILLVGWLLHLSPYMAISRVLFLHHYLPAVPFLCMFIAAMLEHVCYYCSHNRYGQIAVNIDLYYCALFRISQLLHVTMVMVVVYGFITFFPFSYGYPALSNEQVLSRQWQPLWHLLYHKTT